MSISNFHYESFGNGRLINLVYDRYVLVSFYRLLVIFCVINMLNYVDRGVIASNGVNGSIRTCSESGVCTPGSGIQ